MAPFGPPPFRELPREARPFSLLPPWLDDLLERGELPERIRPLPEPFARPRDCLAPNET